MPQKQDSIKPFFINVDTSYENLKPSEAPFIKSLTWDISANPSNTGSGTSNPTGEGQNMLSLSTTRSNERITSVTLPITGWNRNIGSFESSITNEFYYFNYNSLLQHGIYVVAGDTGICQRIIIDPELNFSDEPDAFIADHRVTLRYSKDKDGNIVEKYLLITDGHGWQKWINVIAAIKTNGFDASLNPYWSLQPPHFDRRELLEWPVRPPMDRPEITILENTPADSGKVGQLADRAFQFATANINTDGRYSNFSLYSLPLLIKSADYQNNPDNIPKNVKLKFSAGSPLTEKKVLFARTGQWENNTYQGASILEWGDWYRYDTIDKFTSSGANSPDVIGNDYWLRTNAWANHNYDPVFNTIEYNFDNSRIPDITDQDFANMIQTGMPQLSVALTDLGDAALLGDNRYGYPNFTDNVKDNLDVKVVEKAAVGCTKPLRDIYLYAYIGRCGDTFAYTSQVGYYLGTDKQVRFGGLTVKTVNGDVTVETNESTDFELNFADKNALQVYLKGTQYSAVGEWYYVTQSNALIKLDKLYDFSMQDQIFAAGGILAAGGYFVCRFKLTVPADRYTATIGRHNVSLAGDYRNTSTWIYGIANSRAKSADRNFITIKPGAISTFSKEMEIDCTAGNVDTWGNGADLFYIYCPYETKQGNGKFRFIEGYLREQATTTIPVEMFPYQMTHAAMDDGGQFTDKNGFYWAYTKIRTADVVDIQFFPIVNCAPTNFVVTTQQGGTGYRKNTPVFLEAYNSNVLGGCNRIVVKGHIASLDGSLNYSNIAISIKDGSTVLTKTDGTFTLIVHNGTTTKRISNIYVNAGGNFIITIAGCGQVPLFNFDENVVPCINCNDRIYPININLAIKIDYISLTSVKEGSQYSIGIYGADLAGRVMFVNEIKNILVPSFLKRNNTNATFFRLLINGALQLNKYPDIKWLIPCVSKNLTQRRSVDWVGDYIKYIDANGNVVTDAASAVFCAISITSLLNYNVANNFSVLANYHFVAGDRLLIYDNGDNQLFDVANYGEQINLQIYGTNFAQALINAGITPTTTTATTTGAAPTTTTTSVTNINKDATLIVQYDPRLDKLIDKTGFWIEIYTPTKERDVIPYQDAKYAFPVINGEVAEYAGGGILNPQYNYPVSIDLDYWDTYLFQRSITIPNVGNKFFSHIFQSINVTDNWGREVTSGGRRNVVNKNAKQAWFGADTIKSDDFVKEGFVNGLASFRAINRKDFSTYPFGDIVAMKSERNILLVCCENDWFVVDYNYHYVYPNAQGVMVTNLNEGLSTPHQKIKGKYGIRKADTATFISCEDGCFWLDNRNTAFIKCNYRDAVDISQLQEEYGEKGGIQSYLNSKIQFINQWNNSHPKANWWDSVVGIDEERGCVYLTFRNRKDNTNIQSSYVNTRRDIDLRASETLLYSIQYHGWIRFEGFTPEGYCRLRGLDANVEMYSFAAGVPWKHNNTSTGSFLKFYDIQTVPVIKGVFNNEKSVVKLYQSIAHDSNPNGWFIDLMYTNFNNSFTYLSANQFKKKEGMFYAAILRNMNSYPSNDPADLFRSMIVDGYRIFGRYLVFRMVGNFLTANKYNELNNIYILEAASGNNKK